MAKICLDGELEIKQPVRKDIWRLLNNYQNDFVRFFRRLLTLIMTCLLGYFYGQSHLGPIVVECTTESKITLPEYLPNTGSFPLVTHQ